VADKKAPAPTTGLAAAAAQIAALQAPSVSGAKRQPLGPPEEVLAERAKDADSYAVILETANARGVADPEQALDLFAAEARVTNPKAKAPRAPLVTQYADPEAVRQVVRKSALDMLGQRLSDADESRIVQAYQAYTTQSQQAQYAASNPEGMGGSYTEPMSAQAFAQAQVGATNPQQLGAQRYLDAFGEIAKSLGTLVNAPRTTSGGGVA
jgi:hypothetical protein